MLKKISGYYTTIALIVLNIFVMLIALNIVLGLIVYPLVDMPRNSQSETRATGETQILSPHDYPNEFLEQAYPGWTRQDFQSLITETWTRSFICAPYLHYREAPYNGTYINIHEVGFRYNHAEQVWPPPEDAYVIFVLGGSTTFGYGVVDNETIPAYLASELNTTETLAVYNFSNGTYFSTQELLLLQYLLQQEYRPDMVIMIDGLNDSHTHGPLNYPNRWDPTCGQAQSKSTNNISTVQAFSWVELPMDRLLTSIRYRTGYSPVPEDNSNNVFHPIYTENPLTFDEMIDVYRHNVRMVEVLGEAYGFETIFVVQPVPVYQYNLDNLPIWYWESKFYGTQTFYEQMAERYENENWSNTLWLADIQAGRDELFYVDRVHYTPAFDQEIAGLIADYIETKVWQ